MRFANGEKSIAFAGVRREGGVNKWILDAGGSFKTASEVFADKWYIVELHFNASQGTAELFVDGQKILQIDVDTNDLNITEFQFGIVSAINIQDELIIFANSVMLSTTHQVREGIITHNPWADIAPLVSMVPFAILLALFRKPILKTSIRVRYHGIKELKRMAEITLTLRNNPINQLICKLSGFTEKIGKLERKNNENNRC
jgi:hypothetical protein